MFGWFHHGAAGEVGLKGWGEYWINVTIFDTSREILLWINQRVTATTGQREMLVLTEIEARMERKGVMTDEAKIPAPRIGRG